MNPTSVTVGGFTNGIRLPKVGIASTKWMTLYPRMALKWRGPGLNELTTNESFSFKADEDVAGSALRDVGEEDGEMDEEFSLTEKVPDRESLIEFYQVSQGFVSDCITHLYL